MHELLLRDSIVPERATIAFSMSAEAQAELESRFKIELWLERTEVFLEGARS